MLWSVYAEHCVPCSVRSNLCLLQIFAFLVLMPIVRYAGALENVKRGQRLWTYAACRKEPMKQYTIVGNAVARKGVKH